MKHSNVTYSKATLADVAAMQELVAEEVEKGIILHRSDDEVSTNIRSYILAKDDAGVLLGYTALHIHTPSLAEVRSLIVGKNARGLGVGKGLVLSAVKEGQVLALKKIFVLTYQDDFFKKLGFNEIPKESLPEHKIWADCIKCKHFPVCNEISLIINL